MCGVLVLNINLNYAFIFIINNTQFFAPSQADEAARVAVASRRRPLVRTRSKIQRNRHLTHIPPCLSPIYTLCKHVGARLGCGAANQSGDTANNSRLEHLVGSGDRGQDAAGGRATSSERARLSLAALHVDHRLLPPVAAEAFRRAAPLHLFVRPAFSGKAVERVELKLPLRRGRRGEGERGENKGEELHSGQRNCARRGTQPGQQSMASTTAGRQQRAGHHQRCCGAGAGAYVCACVCVCGVAPSRLIVEAEGWASRVAVG